MCVTVVRREAYGMAYPRGGGVYRPASAAVKADGETSPHTSGFRASGAANRPSTAAAAARVMPSNLSLQQLTTELSTKLNGWESNFDSALRALEKLHEVVVVVQSSADDAAAGHSKLPPARERRSNDLASLLRLVGDRLGTATMQVQHTRTQAAAMALLQSKLDEASRRACTAEAEARRARLERDLLVDTLGEADGERGRREAAGECADCAKAREAAAEAKEGQEGEMRARFEALKELDACRRELAELRAGCVEAASVPPRPQAGPRAGTHWDPHNKAQREAERQRQQAMREQAARELELERLREERERERERAREEREWARNREQEAARRDARREAAAPEARQPGRRPPHENVAGTRPQTAGCLGPPKGARGASHVGSEISVLGCSWKGTRLELEGLVPPLPNVGVHPPAKGVTSAASPRGMARAAGPPPPVQQTAAALLEEVASGRAGAGRHPRDAAREARREARRAERSKRDAAITALVDRWAGMHGD